MFYVNDKAEGKFLYTETTKLYYIVLYQNARAGGHPGGAIQPATPEDNQTQIVCGPDPVRLVR